MHDCAEDYIQLAMRLAYFTTQRPGDVLKMTEADIEDGCIAVKQNKRGKKLRILISGELMQVMQDILNYKKKHNALCPHLLCKGSQRLTVSMLRNGFDAAREKAGISFDDFQFRDIRAKSGTDIEEEGGKEKARDALGHDQESTTNRYLRNRKGKVVTPVSKKI